MSDSVRVNLTVPAKIDALLTELSAASGISKSALVMEAIGWALPHWRRQLRLYPGSASTAPEPLTVGPGAAVVAKSPRARKDVPEMPKRALGESREAYRRRCRAFRKGPR